MNQHGSKCILIWKLPKIMVIMANSYSQIYLKEALTIMIILKFKKFLKAKNHLKIPVYFRISTDPDFMVQQVLVEVFFNGIQS